MATTMRRAFGGLALVAILGATAFAADDAKPAPIDGKAAFAKLKAMAGTWDSKLEHGPHAAPNSTVTYRVTGGGKVVMETLLPGTDHEMVSMYYLDGETLRITHYCAAGNQPKLKLDTAKSTVDHLEFTFDGGTNIDPTKDIYICAGRFDFQPEGKVRCEWDANQGEAKFGTTVFELTKAKTAE